MIYGYMGKLLFVNLSTGEIQIETPAESLYRDYVGGYGIGARILYSRLKPGVDPLGPDNILGFLTGPLTGTPATFAARWTVVGKSPLTGGWGDSNAGGHFAPYFKFAGYDGVFFTGVSAKPVYLFIDNGQAELKDAGFLWGKDCFETEDFYKNNFGQDTESVSIGPPGEKLALMACIVTRRGAVAGRSGLGAVMGSKKLKALAVRGRQEVPVFDVEMTKQLTREQIDNMRNNKNAMENLAGFHKYGTSKVAERFAGGGNTPVKNWAGIGVLDFPDASGLSGDAAIANLESRSGCWHCPVACEGHLQVGKGEYKYPAGTRRVEYETQAAFGTLCLNNDTESINMLNHLCNCNGLDTISAGGTIAFAMECYEKGIISRADTGGIELTWGNHRAIVAMIEKIARREGFGDVLADGSRLAAEKIGRGSDQYAIHIGGQELGMHDPKFYEGPGSTALARYQMDATPGRHTQEAFGPGSFPYHLINATGFCLFSDLVGGQANGVTATKYLTLFLKAVTGWDRSEAELLICGERIANLRHAFNLREGINPLQHKINPRILGIPPQAKGPLAGVTIAADDQIQRQLKALNWDSTTTKPGRNKLRELGLDDVASDLWPAS